MFLLILESLGSTELVFILVMALVFFGPRKLPQLSRSMGKHLAEFRRASEDFKRTWDREVTLEEVVGQNSTPSSTPLTESLSWDENQSSNSLPPPTIEAIPAERIVPRQASESVESSESNESAALSSTDATDLSSVTEFGSPLEKPEPSRKRDWL